jgi:hypothetical protein
MKIPENFGSEEYLAELDGLLHELDKLRSQMGRMERKERFTISRAMESIKSIRRRAERYTSRKDLMSESYVRVACQIALVESVLLKRR